MREIRYIDAIREAIGEEMRRDEAVFVLGETIGPRGGDFTETKGLWSEFGEKRLVDTPISELGFTGLAVGAAMTGLRPIVDIQFWDFAFEAMGQIMEQAARIHYLSNGKIKVPLVVLGTIGAGQSAGGHHSNSPYVLYAHMPGLKVVVPATPYDAKGLLKTAIRDDDPTMFFFHRGLNNTRGLVPEEEYTIPLGQGTVVRQGTDVTLVATAKMVSLAEQAADAVSREGISVEIVDLRTLVPLDKKTILNSIRKTTRLVVVDEAYSTCGVGAEVAALATEGEVFYYLGAPIRRIHPLAVPAPSSPPLEMEMLPSLDQVVAELREVMTQ
jgi:pyruvate dehydrogenase E1 component beta subunit